MLPYVATVLLYCSPSVDRLLGLFVGLCVDRSVHIYVDLLATGQTQAGVPTKAACRDGGPIATWWCVDLNGFNDLNEFK